MQRMAGKRVVVTGAAGGIGEALARGFAEQGARVVASDKNREGLDQTVASLKEEGLEVAARVCDVTDYQQVEGLREKALTHLSGVDVLLANAGGSQGANSPFLELEPPAWAAMLDRNLTSVFYCCLVFGRHMAAHAGGAMVVTSSQLSEVVRPGMAHYATAKGGVRQLVRAMAVDCAPHHIRVNALAPGPTLTPGNRAMFERPDVKDANLRMIPLGRIGAPEEMVGAALYLASDEATFTTGATLMVDGGYTIL
jgi:NAD(P)-dependent dehydrogenase (short-subunit alcohol dehydrogenase family)